MRPSRRIRSSVALACVIAFALAVPSLAFGHAVVLPKASTVETRERYVLRVPNEGSVPTTRVELRVPAGARVTGFLDVAGWSLEVLMDSTERITGAVWTGSLAAKHFAEFPFIAVNPKEPGALSWEVIQTYGANDRVEWTGPEGSDSPASVTTIGPRPVEGGAAPARDGAPAWVAWSALAAGLAGVALSLRRSA